MGAEPARVLDYYDDYMFGAAAPAREFPERPAPLPEEAAEQAAPRQRTRAEAAAAARTAPVLSMFSILGAFVVCSLMLFAVLAQVNYNEVTSETVRLRAQLDRLVEQERRLEVAFESVVDMKEVELYARDVLGMSRPEGEQVAVIRSNLQDRAEIMGGGEDEGALKGFGAFLQSLMGYIKK